MAETSFLVFFHVSCSAICKTLQNQAALPICLPDDHAGCRGAAARIVFFWKELLK